MQKNAGIDADHQCLTQLCRKWAIARLALFGSAARGEAGPRSDIDLLVDFHPDAEWSLMDIARLQEELEATLGRSVDLVERRALRNPYRLKSAQQDEIVLHAA